ncbi:hypothetical protein FRB99_004742 [Tulasnella sp. 403]|nr:hypothetical protein FRB99_004742 [Tulasnella sp. 403]
MEGLYPAIGRWVLERGASPGVADKKATRNLITAAVDTCPAQAKLLLADGKGFRGHIIRVTHNYHGRAGVLKFFTIRVVGLSPAEVLNVIMATCHSSKGDETLSKYKKRHQRRRSV